MKFAWEHSIPADPDTAAEVTLDAGYQESIGPVVEDYLSERTLLSQSENDDGTVHRDIRCVLGIELPGGARRFIGNREPAWIEHALYHPGSLRWEWTIEPEVGGRLMTATGAMTFEPQGAKTLRRVEGEISFHVPVYGGRVEEVVVHHLEMIYAAEARHLGEWITSGR